MTTIAFDGQTIAADTLTTDNWGLKHYDSKIYKGNGFWAAGSGNKGTIMKWFQQIKGMSFDEVIEYGYPTYDRDKDDLVLIVCKAGLRPYRHTEGVFLKCNRLYHAAGSGRDFALAAMHLGLNAYDAVKVAMEFDNATGGEIEIGDNL